MAVLSVLVLGAPLASAQEPADPEPIEDFWTAEEEAIAREQTAADAETQAAPAPAPASAAPSSGEPAPAPPVAVAPACTPQVTLRRTLDALQVAAGRPLPARGGRRVRAVSLVPCESGRVRVEIRTAGSDVLLARDDVVLRAGVPARVRVQTTRAVRRYAGRGPIRLTLRARLTRVR